MALGVEAAGTVLTAGNGAREWAPGDAVMTHPVPLPDQGTWAPRLIAPAGLLARKPPDVSWAAAAAFPVPALTARQVLVDALGLHAGEHLLVNGASGATGSLLVTLAVLHGAQVIARGGRQAAGAPASADNARRASTGSGAAAFSALLAPLPAGKDERMARRLITSATRAANAVGCERCHMAAAPLVVRSPLSPFG